MSRALDVGVGVDRAQKFDIQWLIKKSVPVKKKRAVPSEELWLGWDGFEFETHRIKKKGRHARYKKTFARRSGGHLRCQKSANCLTNNSPFSMLHNVTVRHFN